MELGLRRVCCCVVVVGLMGLGLGLFAFWVIIGVERVGGYLNMLLLLFVGFVCLVFALRCICVYDTCVLIVL